ncbi:ligand-binding sensor domain-containing diguanylate cyclase [soil metagenome]
MDHTLPPLEKLSTDAREAELLTLNGGRTHVARWSCEATASAVRCAMRHLCGKASLSIFLLCCLGRNAQAQYQFDTWTADNGLPQNIIRGLSQTSDGYLWLATLNGLARFDGIRFTVFDKSNTPGISSNRFTSMHKGRDGDLWLDIEGGGLTRYHRGTFHTYGTDLGVYDTPARVLAGNEAGAIWILAGNNIAQWDDRAGRFVDITPKDSAVHYTPARWETDGFWGWDKTGLHLFFEGRFVTLTLPSWLPGETIWGLARDQSGTIWIETQDGQQAKISPGKTDIERVGHGAPPAISYAGFHGHTWTMHIGQRLSRSLDTISSGRAITISFSRFFQDRQENLWLGTEGEGLYRLQKQTIQVYSTEQGLLDRNIYPIYQDHTGAVWIGAWQKGLSRLDHGRFTNYSVDDGLPARLVTALAEDATGRLWVGTHGGLAIFDKGKFAKPPGPALPEGAVVQAILQDRTGALWFGTDRGAVRYKDGATEVLTIDNGLATNDVRVLLEGASGDLWIGGYGGLSRLQNQNGKWTRWREGDGLPSKNVRALYEDADGVLWIGTYDGGLGRLQNGKLTRYSVSNGLYSNGVFQILEDKRGNLWMSSNRGIYRASKKELNDFAAGRASTITSTAYGKVDGMLNVECNGGLSPAGIKTREGKLLFPTQDGVAVVDPEVVSDDRLPPPVLIESSLVDRVAVPISAPIKIAPGKENLEIEYTAPSFIKPEQIRFKYRLEGLQSNWIDAGARRTAYYSHLPPGKYVFRVIAGNSDGAWNVEGSTLAVEVMAPFYLTPWFTALMIFLSAVLVGLAWFYRVSKLKAKQVAQRAFSQQLISSQERERKRIAAELHDSIGQRLVIINNLALSSLRSDEGTRPPQEKALALEEISAEALSAIKETREISYDLRPFQLDRLGLTKAIGSVVRSVSAASGMSITAEVDNIDDLFPEELRINLYRIVQECLTNIMKHAQATQVTVRVQRENRHMILTIRDNGKGFVVETSDASAAARGFGLSGMAERAHLLGGKLKVNSTIGRGTDVVIEIVAGGAARG